MYRGKIVELTATELSDLIHKHEISCRSVMEAYLKQIKKLNPEVNAVVGMRDESSLLADADQADSELALGKSRGWLHGFPLAVKDKANIVEGLVGTSGCAYYGGCIGNKDAIFVQRIREEGAIFIGRTNMPELGLGSHSYNRIYGTTCNAFNKELAGGGSSGGAAVALALNMLPVADGSDTMGSLRNPAAWNNVYGFRPTVGLIPSRNLRDLFFSPLSTDGPMARNIEDLSRLLNTMAGCDAACPLSFDYSQNPGKYIHGSRPFVAWLGDMDGHLAMDPDLLANSRNACYCLTRLASVTDLSVEFDLNRLWEAWCTIRAWVMSNSIDSLPTQLQKDLNSQAEYEIKRAKNLTAKDISVAEVVRSNWYKKLLEYFDQFDFLVLPSTQVWPFPKHWEWPKVINGRKMDTYHRWMEVALYASFIGLPSISVPVGFGANGLAFGLQVIAPRNQEAKLLEFVKHMEQVFLTARNNKALPA